MSASRTRWAALGAAVAVTLGAGGIGLVNAAVDSGERTVFVPIEPCRLVDTRAASPVGSTPTLQEDAAVVIDAHGVQGDCDLPTDASGVAMNVTAVDPTDPTNVRIYPTPSDDSVPLTANLNPFPGLPQEFNSVVTDLNDQGQFSVYNRFGSVDLVIDVVGYYADHTHDDRYYTEDEIDAALPIAAGAASADDQTDVGSAAVVLTVDMTAPLAGTVVAESVATITGGGGATLASCSLSLDTAMEAATTQSTDTGDGSVAALAALGTFDVEAGAAVAVNLVCESDGAVTISNPQLVVTFHAAEVAPTTTTIAPTSTTSTTSTTTTTTTTIAET